MRSDRVLQRNRHVVAKNGERSVLSPGVLSSLKVTNGVTAKLDDVARILSELKADLDAKKLSTQRMSPTLHTRTLR